MHLIVVACWVMNGNLCMLNDVEIFICVAWLDANCWQCFECIAGCAHDPAILSLLFARCRINPLVQPACGPWCIAWMSWGCWSSCLADFAVVLHGWLNVADIVHVVAGIGCGYVISGQWILFMVVQCSWHNPKWLVCIIYVGCGVCMLILLMDIA